LKGYADRSKDYQGIHYGQKLHPDEAFESVDDEHEPPCTSLLNNLIGCGGKVICEYLRHDVKERGMDLVVTSG
jgi:hypothetical protein